MDRLCRAGLHLWAYLPHNMVRCQDCGWTDRLFARMGIPIDAWLRPTRVVFRGPACA